MRLLFRLTAGLCFVGTLSFGSTIKVATFDALDSCFTVSAAFDEHNKNFDAKFKEDSPLISHDGWNANDPPHGDWWRPPKFDHVREVTNFKFDFGETVFKLDQPVICWTDPDPVTTTSQTPEPATLGLVGGALLVAGALGRKRHRRN